MFRTIRHSLVARITAFAVVMAVVVALGVSVILFWALEKAIDRNLDNHLSAYADVVVSAIRIKEGKVHLEESNALLQNIPRHWQISQGETPLYRSPSLLSWIPLRESADAKPGRVEYVTTDGTTLLLLLSTFLFPKDIAVTVIFGLDKTVADAYKAQERSQLQGTLIIIVLVIVISLAIVVLVFSTVMTKPLRSVQAAMHDVKTGKSQRLEGQWPLELRGLTDEVNQLIDANDTLIERYRRFAGNLAHALKTPLTTIRNERDPELIKEKVDTLLRLVDRNLARVRAVGDSVGSKRSTLIKPVVEKITRNYQRLYDKQITVQCNDGRVFQGDEHDLFEILGHVIENACQHAKGVVDVCVNDVAIVVEDDGFGIPPTEYENVLHRGTRLDEARPGSGIGLAVTRDIVELYQGEIRLGAAASGGLRVELRLPLARS